MIPHQVVKIIEGPQGSRVYVHAEECPGCTAKSPLPDPYAPSEPAGGTWVWEPEGSE